MVIQRTEKEGQEIKVINEIFSKPSTYIDIGAQIGYWTFARKHILNENIKFYCFEPSRLNFMYLQKNLDKFENIKGYIIRSFKKFGIRKLGLFQYNPVYSSNF